MRDVKIRSIDQDCISNVAIVDLLPGGFDVAINSVREAEKKSGEESILLNYVNPREDRVVIYCTACRSAREFIYRIKAVNKGQFTVPPVQAESMYNPLLLSRGKSGKMVVGEK